MAGVEGLAKLRRRLDAIQDPKAHLGKVQTMIVEEARANSASFRKTGHLQRSIVRGRLTDRTAEVFSNAPYSGWVEKGTGIFGPRKRPITPKNGRALKFTPGGANTRLTGRSRIKAGAKQAGEVFARSVKGRPATPFWEPAIKSVAR